MGRNEEVGLSSESLPILSGGDRGRAASRYLRTMLHAVLVPFEVCCEDPELGLPPAWPIPLFSTSTIFAWECKVHSASSQLTRSPGAPHSSPPDVVKPFILSADKEELKMFSSETLPVFSFAAKDPNGTKPRPRRRLAGLYSSSSLLYSPSPSSCPSTTTITLCAIVSMERQTRVH